MKTFGETAVIEKTPSQPALPVTLDTILDRLDEIADRNEEIYEAILERIGDLAEGGRGYSIQD